MVGRGVVSTPWERRCIGILCILSLAVVNSCPDFDNTTINCDILPVAGLNCTYVKGLPKDPLVNSYQVPGPVEILSVGTGYAQRKGKCETRLNITWKVQKAGSLDYLRGFYLNISFVYNKSSVFLHRTFNVSSTDWNSASNTLFRHECVVPARGTLYHIELYSLPMNDKKHHKTIEYHTASNVSSGSLCDPIGDPDNSSAWVADMWSLESASNGTIEVCFYTAPSSYNFSKYVVSLLPNAYDPLNRVVDQKPVSVDVSKDLKIICEKFVNVCSGVYKIWVMPKNDPHCTCRLRGSCLSSCTATVVENIDMTTKHRRSEPCIDAHGPWRLCKRKCTIH